MTGAEVVQGDQHPKIVELAQDGDDVIPAIHDGMLGDLQAQLERFGHAGECGYDVGDQSGVSQPTCGGVDRKSWERVPGPCPRRGLLGGGC